MAQNDNVPLYDHLRCYKASDSVRAMALADLITNDAQRELLPDEADCSIVVNSQEFCVPVDKKRKPIPPITIRGVTINRDAPYGDFAGFGLKNDFLCYKVRCSQTQGVLPRTLKVIDQFGPHNLVNLKTTTLCTPAYKESVRVYETPILQSAIVEQQFDPVNRQVSFRLLTSESQEYYLASIANVARPVGWALLSASEDVAARDCPPGIPTLGEEGNHCNQFWDLVYQVAPEICELNGNHSYSFDVDCNPAMPHCDLANPAAPDATVDFATDSATFCEEIPPFLLPGAQAPSAPTKFTAVARRAPSR